MVKLVREGSKPVPEKCNHDRKHRMQKTDENFVVPADMRCFVRNRVTIFRVWCISLSDYSKEVKISDSSNHTRGKLSLG